MFANLRSVSMLLVALAVALAITTRPGQAADESKGQDRRIRKLERKVARLEAKLAYMNVVQGPINGLDGPHVIFEACNVHVRSGSGDSTDGTFDLINQAPIPDTEPLGLGNLIVGYNEQLPPNGLNRGGSHNFIVGPGHNYPNVGGGLFGQENSVNGPLATVTGGIRNTASGFWASVSGGSSNAANGVYSTVTGGGQNTTGDFGASVSGGFNRTAPGDYDWVGGGLFQAS
jgi:hypothetical protein